MSLVEISDSRELLAVHRALMELRSVKEPNNVDVIGSRFVAQFAHRVLDALIELEEKQGNVERVNQWKTWRTIDESRSEWGLLQHRIRSVHHWEQISEENRRGYINDVASPFILSSEQVELFLQYGDNFHAKQ